MAIRNHNRPIALYGISDAISGGAPEPIIANRAPQTNDIAALGTPWILPGSEEIWFLTEVKGNVATWTTFFGNVASVTAGTGINLTGTAQNPIINLTVPVTIAHGGTNATSMAHADGVVYYDGTSLVTTTVGSAGEILTSNGAGMAPTFQAAPASGIVTIDGNTGSATGSTVTLQGSAVTAGTLVFNASGSTITLDTEDVNANVLVGAATATLPAGTGNSGFGHNPFAQGSLVTGDFNAAFGYDPFLSLTSGSHNAGFGQQPLLGLVSGDYNLCASAYQGGVNYTGAESSNISINASATTVTGESNTCRIGDGTGAGIQQLSQTFIYGIAGITTTVNDAVPVLISASTSQLGTVSSSARYKTNIQDMAGVSSPIYKLRPTTFSFKTDKTNSQQVGLIAEEVDGVMPNLVVYDKEGRPETIKYQDLPVLLLNEIQKLKARIDELEAKS